MKFRAYIFYLFIFFTAYGFSQNDKTLLTIDGESVSVKEFLRIYNKNLDMVQDESQKNKETYLDLFINYKLKTKEAYAQGINKEPAFLKEFSGYQKQLSENYLYDQEITEELIKEAYERIQIEINANHILIRVTEDATPKDTLVAYNKIKEIWLKAKNGEDFETLAKTYSEEPKAAETAGSLGYFKGFSMVYPFENMAYKTPVGQVSDIFKTRYGYHILKVNDRRVVPDEVTVAHIMISNREGISDEEGNSRIQDIYKKIKQGEDFGALATQFSEDSSTAKNDGKLARFGSGRLNSKIFEETAFALKNPGDVSEPIKSSYGWHVIKLIERHPKETLEEARPELLNKVKNNDRSNKVIANVNQRIKEKYGFTKNEKALSFFNNFVTDSVLKRNWDYKEQPELKSTLFTIGNKKHTFEEFAKYIVDRQKKSRVYLEKEMLLNTYYEEFEEEKLKQFFINNLENENEEYAATISEYRDGLLLYELMQKNIWEPSKKDSIGLLTYFNKNRNHYVWNTRVQANIGATASLDIAKQIKDLLIQGKTNEEIKAALNTEEVVNAIMTTGIFELEHPLLPENFEIKKGVSKIYTPKEKENTKSGQFIVVDVQEVILSSPKNIEDVKGKVIGDYQNHLEEEWMKELRKKYVIKVNKKVLK
ncbi:MAG: peptidylprolyl isomerase [Bacteroidetes bacterium HGW-Bacteroidetes-2]|jgi:peptidyl-prolyl cis-trans isomerase SurA|nr:MAG: peptidylprolyl isomerase [Bacteroidetes bacterium HGW-Bacteroidetes-2]